MALVNHIPCVRSFVKDSYMGEDRHKVATRVIASTICFPSNRDTARSMFM